MHLSQLATPGHSVKTHKRSNISIYLSSFRYIRPPTLPSKYPFIYPFTHLSILLLTSFLLAAFFLFLLILPHPSTHPPVCLSPFQSLTHPSISFHPLPVTNPLTSHPCTHLCCMHPSSHPCIHPHIHPSIQPSMYLSIQSSTHPSIQSSMHPSTHSPIYPFYACIYPCIPLIYTY